MLLRLVNLILLLDIVWSRWNHRALRGAWRRLSGCIRRIWDWNSCRWTRRLIHRSRTSAICLWHIGCLCCLACLTLRRIGRESTRGLLICRRLWSSPIHRCCRSLRTWMGPGRSRWWLRITALALSLMSKLLLWLYRGSIGRLGPMTYIAERTMRARGLGGLWLRFSSYLGSLNFRFRLPYSCQNLIRNFH